MDQISVDKWREALLLPDESDLRQSGLRELAEYFGLTPAEAERQCESALSDSKREWEQGARRTTEQILDFYDQTRSYIFEHIWWHATDLAGNAANVVIIEYASGQGAREYLDFGSGVGSNAILAARRGLQVTLADVSKTMLEFARWRLERRGLKANYLYLREQKLPLRTFDFVTALDVMEHLPAPTVEIRQISAALKTGGLLVFNARPGFDAARPMHILPTMYPVRRALRGSGLGAETGPDADRITALECHVCRKSNAGWMARLGWRLYDCLRFSALAETISHRLAPRPRSDAGERAARH
jgi:SAM-dependent methyltransferase